MYMISIFLGTLNEHMKFEKKIQINMVDIQVF